MLSVTEKFGRRMIAARIGEPIPSSTNHAISVCLPSWESVIGYKENDPIVLNAMTTGYPRFFIHKSIQRLCELLTDKYAKENETCLCFPSYKVAKRCREFIRIKSSRNSVPIPKVRILQLATSKPVTIEEARWKKECRIAVVYVDKAYYKFMKQYWQYTGEVISSRLSEYVLHELFIVEKSSKTVSEANASAKKSGVQDSNDDYDDRDNEEYIETRYGRNLNFAYGDRAKALVKKRIATKVADNTELDIEDYENYYMQAHLDFPDFNIPNGSMGADRTDRTDQTTEDDNAVQPLITSAVPAEPIEMDSSVNDIESENSYVSVANELSYTNRQNLRIDPEKDVFLFPSGMASIFTAHRLLLSLDSRRVHRSRSSANVVNSSSSNAVGLFSQTESVIGYGSPYKKTVLFGFSNNDTVNILKEFNHTHFLGDGASSAMEKLEQTLHSGEQILAVFIEAPSNPLLKMADFAHLRKLANIYGFYIVIDETIGGFVNIDVLPYADIVCSSLTKIFSGDSNVLAGCMVLNPQEKLFQFSQMFMNQLSEYEDHLWCEDAIYLERNSRDFIARTIKINKNTDYLLKNVLIPQEGPSKLFKKIFYPSLTSKESKDNYDFVRCKVIERNSDEEGGYGGLFSLEFHKLEQAKVFFDELKLSEGPSLGTNSTLACPCTVLAHFDNLEEVGKYHIAESLVRVSIGLENLDNLSKVFQTAINKALDISDI